MSTPFRVENGEKKTFGFRSFFFFFIGLDVILIIIIIAGS